MYHQVAVARELHARHCKSVDQATKATQSQPDSQLKRARHVLAKFDELLEAMRGYAFTAPSGRVVHATRDADAPSAESPLDREIIQATADIYERIQSFKYFAKLAGRS